jgi:anti-sigma factor RsiW
MTDQELTQLLVERLPRHAAPYALLQQLHARAEEAPRGRRRRRAWLAAAALALAAAAILLVVVWPRGDLAEEGVAEHLRLVASAQPVAVESGGIHQVKPWFTGRVDFAPRVAFAGDDEFPLVGGNLARLGGRPAAVFVWKRRLHTISLFVFRAGRLEPHGARVGRLDVNEEVRHGFDVLSWRDGDLGYCLVSDVSRADLEELARRVAGY